MPELEIPETKAAVRALLDTAIAENNYDDVSKLLASPLADVSDPNEPIGCRSKAPLSIEACKAASRHNDYRILKLLLQRPEFNIRATDWRKKTSLHYATIGLDDESGSDPILIAILLTQPAPTPRAFA